MKQTFNFSEYIKQHHNRSRQRWIAAVLGCFVVFFVAFALIRPASTMERSCGIEEHTHTDDCYTHQTTPEVTTLTCGFIPHVHEEACGDACGYGDFAVHSHSELCYQDDTLVCTLPEILPHTHDETCYGPAHTHTGECYAAELGQPNCGLEVREAHAHTEACYRTQTVCAPEDPQTHIHQESCYESTQVCPLEETEGHAHTEACYPPVQNLICTEDTETQVLTCTLQEIILHTHTESCFSSLDGEAVLTCPLVEVLRHDHDETCTTVTTAPADLLVLTCTTPEHTHTEECRPAQAESTAAQAQTASAETQTQETQPQAAFFALRPCTTLGSGTFASTEGNELSWKMDYYTLTGEYVLTVSGEGTMPAFPQSGKTPWYNTWATSCNYSYINLVLGNGLKNVSTHAFSGMHFSSITFGSAITSIDSLAFQGGNGPAELSFPKNITNIGQQAFSGTNFLTSVTLSEGLKTVGYEAFPLHTMTSAFSTVHIPASVTSIAACAFGQVGSYTVDPNNQHYCAVDGVLYNKDVTTLIDYPKYLAADTYRIPNTVTTINPDALTRVQNVKHLYIPSSVQNTPSNLCCYSNWQSVTIEDGATVGSNGNLKCAFELCSSLVELRLPENSPYTFDHVFVSCSSLQHLTIPAGTQYITTPGYNMPQLQTVSYNARQAAMQDRDILDATTSIDLTIGVDVDKLSYVFHEFTEKARSIRFEGPNFIDIDHNINDKNVNTTERAFQDAPAPFRGLTGSIYIDGQGVIYTLDKATLAASIYCVQPGSTEVTIPAAITGEDGTVYTVTSVRTDALKYAGQLQSISFAAPESITDLQALALANCPSLTRVGGKTTVEEASALFPNATLGYHLFYNTGLSGAPESSNFSQEMQGSENLDTARNGAWLQISVVTEDGKTPPWTPGETSTGGGYRLLTNQAVSFTASVGSTQEYTSSHYRIYFRFTDSSISHSMLLGKEETFNDSSGNLLGHVAYCATEDPCTIYAEISAPSKGSTLGIPLSANYPNGTAGGGLTVWGVIVDENAAPGIVEPESPENTIQAWWDTQAEDFALTSRFTTAGIVGVIGDNAGSGKPSADLQWTVTLSRATETTSPDGKDYVQQTDLESIFTLPAGVQWHPDILEALNAGVPISFHRIIGRDAKLIFSVGDIPVANIVLPYLDLFFQDPRVVIESSPDGSNSTGGSATFRWTFLNKTGNAEINTATAYLTVYASALQINSTIPTDPPSCFTNESTASVSYSFRDDAVYSVDPETGAQINEQLHDSANLAISGGSSNIRIAASGSAPRYFGEDITFTTRLYNDGSLAYVDNETSPTAGYTIQGVLPNAVYIKPENMVRMFDPDTPAVASITIKNAVLGEWDSVSGVDGSTVNLHPGNSDIGSGSHTLTITKNDGVYQVAVTGGETYRSTDLSEALKNAGYAVTASAEYSCLWKLNAPGTAFTLPSGESRYFYTYATIKDSFQTITQDYPGEYPPSTPKTGNYIAYLFAPSKPFGHTFSNAFSVYREAIIHKSVACNKQVLTDFSSINDGDVLDYQLTFTHYGSGTPTDLPFVDDLYGSQHLLVPIDSNPQLANLNLETHGSYYILSEGNYKDIVVGVDDEKNPLVAASVTVRSASSEDSAAPDEETTTLPGLHTHIEWYFSQLPQGFYQTVISYPALVDMELTGVDYTIGNTIYLNNRTETHLYDTLLGGGTLLDFSLDILEAPGDAPASDVKDADGHTLITPGEAVNYRATISSDRDLCLPGSKLAIGLPLTFDLFDWELGVNVTDLRIETENGVTITETDNIYIANGYAADAEDRQFILWPDGSEVSFDPSSTLYIYFTLTYPSDTQTYARTASDSLWDRYSDALRGSSPKIDLLLYNHPDSVQHDLKEPGAVLLQKGVLGTYLYRSGQAMKPTTSRLYFNNRDSWNRVVTYYVVLYNGDNKWLYVEDMYDQLPAGFTFLTMLNSNGSLPNQNTSSIVTSADGKFDLLDVADPNVSFRSAVITANASPQGLTFQISADPTNHPLRYDEQKQQYYLERGEALAFAYVCDVGLASQTQSKAVNQIVMPYVDDSETGVFVLSKQDVAVRAAQSPYFSDENDGTRISVPAQDFPSLPDTGHDTLLVSQVTLQKGSIVPGVIKSTESYQQNLNATPTSYTGYAPHNAIVNWHMQLHNSGTLSMSDYTLTDVMPYPYSFVGNVSCTLFDGKAMGLISIPQHALPKNTPLEEIPLADRTLKVTDLTDPASKTYNLVIGGEPVKMGAGGYGFCVSVNVDDRGNEVLSIQFEGLYWTIPEGESMDVFLSGVNATGSFFYSVFTNQAYLVPSQAFSSVSQGSMVRGSAGQPTAVRNADSVTVSTSHSTSSHVSVTQICSGTQESHTATSGEDRNFIVLEKDNPNFTYTLQVTNDTNRAMTNLVLINNLPQAGDHSPFNTGTERGSEFTVSLADGNIEVMIKPKTGEAYAATQYQVQFSTGTDFGGSNSVHWRGETPDASDSTQWTDDPTGARSIRVILGESIPADASVIVTFPAVVPNDLAPGQTAWNNFGYHYRLEGDYVELEAMPPVVGVKSPSIPSLSKHVLDINGNPIPLAQDTQFTFVVCEGSLPGDSFTTAEELASLLRAAGRDYRIFSLAMEAGSSVSSPLCLAFDNWHWRDGQTYTVVEILEGNTFTFRRFLGTGSSFYTFSYDPAVQQQILCENTLNHWSVAVTKTNPIGSPLEDALFGLYSPNAADQINGEGFGAPNQITYNGSTWYLSHIGTTDGQGCILWDQLARSSYYLLEIQPPPGHLISEEPGRLLYRSTAEDGIYRVSMVNEPSYELPKTGSMGTAPFSLLGLLLMAAAVLALLPKKKASC